MRNKGEGTIYKRKDGRWVAALQVSGKRRWVYLKAAAKPSTSRVEGPGQKRRLA